MPRQSQRLYDLLRPVVDGLGYALWGVEQSGSAGQGLIRIYIDSEQGISLDDCEKVSRQVEAVLDVEEPLSGSYTLEVSSPGTDRPLFNREQFQAYCGETVSLKLGRKIENRRKFFGVLEAVGEDSVSINTEGTVYEIPLQLIDKANLVWQQ